jgi:hypothetical protein
MLDQLTVESFAPHVGTSFGAETSEGQKVELRLTSARKVMESQAAHLQRHPFSLYFTGPPSPLLEQRIYHLTHDSIGAMDLFLVPIGKDAEGYRYEAVFT